MFPVVLSWLALGVSLLALARAWTDHRKYRAERDKLATQLGEAERLIRHRGNLANEIAHEIKNPITAILCSAETLDLLLGDELNPDHRKSLQYIREYGDNLLRLVSDFLDVSRAEAGKIVCRPQAVEVANIVESIIGLLKPGAERKEITLKNLSSDRGIRALVDPIHLKQVLFNLLYNALKFTPRGGEIQVSVENAFPLPLVQIEVRDNGPGIPSNQIPFLFDPYTRYDRRSSGVFDMYGPGVGLGLALCKSLVDLAGGTIAVESQEGVGTSFSIRLPEAEKRALTSDGAQGGETAYSSKILAGQQILILDQDAGARDAVARLIEAWGGIVKQVNDASQAVKAISEGSFSSVIVDPRVSDDCSQELVDNLLQVSKGKTTKVILADGSGNQELSNSESAEVKRVQKPFSGEKLLRVLAPKE